MIRLYKKIPWDNLPAIQEKSLDYLTKTIPNILTRPRNSPYYTIRQTDEFLRHVPEIQVGAARYGLITVLLDEVEIDCVTVIRVNTAHTVFMPPKAPNPRITLTLSFDKDPTFLLDADLSSLNTA